MGDLAVIGAGEARGAFVMRARLAGLAEGLAGPRVPVMAARHRRRVLRDLDRACEQRLCGGGIVQEAECDPARGEQMLDLRAFLFGHGGFARDPERRARLAGIEQLAREQPALFPPFVRIMHGAGRTGGRKHRLGGLVDLVGPPQVTRAREQISGVAPHVAGHRIQQPLRLGGFVVDRRIGLDDRDLRGAEPLRRAQRRVGVLGIEPSIHPRLVVAAGQQRAEAVEHLPLHVRAQRIGAPGVADQRLGLRAVALRHQGARIGELALGGQRLGGREIAPRPPRR